MIYYVTELVAYNLELPYLSKLVNFYLTLFILLYRVLELGLILSYGPQGWPRLT